MTLGLENTGDCIESYTEAERQWKFDFAYRLERREAAESCSFGRESS